MNNYRFTYRCLFPENSNKSSIKENKLFEVLSDKEARKRVIEIKKNIIGNSRCEGLKDELLEAGKLVQGIFVPQIVIPITTRLK
ncbi:MAG: hypothetical protein AAB432_02160 [Patescibacteria group bacterium]